MEVIITLVLIIGLLVLLDLAALKWGVNSSLATWPTGGYDPRYNWNSPTIYPSIPEEEASEAALVASH